MDTDRGPFARAHILTGPTGVGKTEISLRLAEALHAEIVSADSMAVYRGMDVVTAKPGPEERLRVPHHLIDVLDPWESASVAWWLEQALSACRAIESRGRRVLMVGGTPFYLKAMLFGLFEGPSAEPEVRARLEAEAQRDGPEALHRRLAGVDPASAARLHPNDVRRVVRALEVWQTTGRPLSALQQQWTGTEALRTEQPILCLDRPREELYARIDRRVRQMVDAGLVEEVRGLLALPRPLSREARQAAGVQEITAYLEGRQSLEEAVRHVQTRTRQLAKRQLTWFRHWPQLRIVPERLTFAAWGLTMEMGTAK